MTLRNLILLLSGLICLKSLPVLAETEELYRFERMWPVLQQPWYFDEIWDIAISQQGYVYVVDRRNNRVHKWTSDGHLVSQFGTFSDDLRPIEIAVDSEENVYVSYTVTHLLVDSDKETLPEMFSETAANRLKHWSHLIRKFNANGELISDKWRENAQCSENMGHIAVDDQDNVYMTCVSKAEGQALVHKLTSDGQWLERWPIYSDGNIAIDREHIYILDRKGNHVHKYTLGGDRVMDWKTDENSQTSDFVYRTKDIAVDSHSNIYVTDNFNRIQQFTSEGHLIKEQRDEINLNGTFQMLFQQLSLMQWQALQLALYSMLCPATGSVLNEANENVETCSQWQLFEALLDHESSFPTTIAVGPQNKLYVGYTMPSSAINKYTSAGQFITQWASGGSSTPQLLQTFSDLLQGFMQLADDSGGKAPFQFHQPTDITMDKSGELYVVDALAHRVLKFSTKEGKIGELVSQWGKLGDGEGQFSSPKGIAIDTDDNIYIVDAYNYRIQKFTANGTFITQWGKPGTGDSDFLALAYIAVDKSNNVYVVDYLARQIKKFTSNGDFITAFGDKHLILPWSIAVDNNDTIYVIDPEKGSMNKFTTDGDFLGEWHTQSSQEGQFEKFLFAPLSVATDAVGNVYVSNYAHDRIQKFAPNGQFITQWGSFGTNPGQFKDS
ncbi:MAG TPA: 6-bladed beta-propeller, partial [Thioploca sp.]|nr:6-bladed beta-propeller [Thioploca sp.]